jgi:hypothetical protein
MEQDIERKIDQLTRLTEENNKLLKKVRRVQKWAQISSFIRYLVVIGIALGTFYFLKPYYDQVMDLYNRGTAQINSLQGYFSPSTSTKVR